jgi:hypothetical protein
MLYDVIIVGGGIAGFYTAYKLQTMYKDMTILLLEKQSKKYIGGRTGNATFAGVNVVTGAGIGRKKDKRLIQLCKELHIQYSESVLNPHYASTINPIDVKEVMDYLKKVYTNHYTGPPITFKDFATYILGEEIYNRVVITNGYSDYENEDARDVIFHYGMEDNICCLKYLCIPWKKLILALASHIKKKGDIHFSTHVVNIEKQYDRLYKINCENEKIYFTKKVIIATTITSIHKLLPDYPIYNQIHSQPFLRLYGKFSKSSALIMKSFVSTYTIVPFPLQKLIPMDSDKGVYMIAYSDNNNATILKKILENTPTNRDVFCRLIEKALGIPPNTLTLLQIADYYWNVGTHYYSPLVGYKTRKDFIHHAQHPTPDISVVGEVVSEDQGWTEGALSSVDCVINSKCFQTCK